MSGLPIISDPLENVLNVLTSLGYNIEDYLSDTSYSIDYPMGTEEEFLRHYVLGLGQPFTDFLTYVDAGVGFTIEPVFKDENEGEQAKQELERYYEKIDFLNTISIDTTYFLALGRSSIVLTKNALGDGWYYNKKQDIMGIDPINPMTLTEESIKKVKNDFTGLEVYKQQYSDSTGESQTIELEQDRVIYRTRNPFGRSSLTGISTYQNSLKELRELAKYPRLRGQVAWKLSNIFRHYVIDNDMIKDTPLGKKVLNDPEEERNYLNFIQNMIMQQELRHPSIATFKWLRSEEKSFAGKEPPLDVIEKRSLDSLAFKQGVPLNLTMFGEDVNRSTLDTIGLYFIKRREKGPQNKHRILIQDISNQTLKLWGYEGTVKIHMNKFIEDDENAVYQRVGDINQKMPGIMDLDEARELIKLPKREVVGEKAILSKLKSHLESEGLIRRL